MDGPIHHAPSQPDDANKALLTAVAAVVWLEARPHGMGRALVELRSVVLAELEAPSRRRGIHDHRHRDAWWPMVGDDAAAASPDGMIVLMARPRPRRAPARRTGGGGGGGGWARAGVDLKRTIQRLRPSQQSRRHQQTKP